ncbi:MAG: beta-lysine N6-acetyltransferase [Clostridiales bacterium]|jgi:putative beta-lysine N-acetyltransferase|nr:beta-lysine N6-acetyltransferase [Clostridiales bacterium]MDK2933493.1 beta-lysine N6-acetyltransferase [Clostridiales bacterium]
MGDTILKIGNSTIQHGKENNRIYLMKMDKRDTFDIIPKLDELAKQHNYTKIFAKIPASSKQLFLDNEYVIEANVPNFYKGTEDAFFMGKYFSAERKIIHNQATIEHVLETALKKEKVKRIFSLNEHFEYRKARPQDAPEMADVYKLIFESYPFPIHQPSYIQKTMEKNIEYFGVWHKGNIVALASSEMDLETQNVEMTDFATLPEYRGNKFALYLLDKMEQEMHNKGIKTAYTIARAVSYGMNSTFAKMGYTYSGTLVNNTNISGSLESMNVWYKPI